MNQIDVDALATNPRNWAAYVQYVADHPAIAATYHVEYDENGNAIGGLPDTAGCRYTIAILCITADL